MLWLALALTSNLHVQRTLWVLVLVYVATLPLSVLLYRRLTTNRRWWPLVALQVVVLALGYAKVSLSFAVGLALIGALPILVQRWPRGGVALAALGYGWGLYTTIQLGLNPYTVPQLVTAKHVGVALLLSAWWGIAALPQHRQVIKVVVYVVLAILSGVWVLVYLSPSYLLVIGVTLVFVGLLRVLTEQSKQSWPARLAHVATVLVLNALTFYVFTDYTHVLQLADQL